ncbi:MAG: DUF4743 domain-containing protein [Azospirillaceae bacterium]|nr:DUF4743 domain-containing protein [Azospirillaceae bacterium]
MNYLRHIRTCNRHDPAGFVDFVAAGVRLGRVRHALARTLSRLPGFAVSPDAIVLAGDDFEERSAFVAGAVDHLIASGDIPGLRHEFYPGVPRRGAEPLFRIDRAAIVHFGIAAYGVHLNGFVRRPDGIHMWVAIRARDRAIAPGKFDNIVAGGQPIGLSLRENLIKEASEEAGMTVADSQRAQPVGAITYSFETPAGLKVDTMFLYDLELPSSFSPRNSDGEVEAFELWPLAAVAERVRLTDDFKFNVNLVVIDFMIRHGFLVPEHPEYLDLVRGLHA